MPFRQQSDWVDPSRCHWRHSHDVTSPKLSFLRVFYEACDETHAQSIGNFMNTMHETKRKHTAETRD